MLADVTGYDLVKFFHVLFAIAWVGGGLGLTVLAELIRRRREPGSLAAFLRNIEWMGTRYFLPVSLATFGLGFWVVEKGGWDYGKFWIVYAIVGFVASVLLGAGFIGPEAGRIHKLIDAQGPDAPVVLSRIERLIWVARIDYVILISIVFMMVTKVGQ